MKTLNLSLILAASVGVASAADPANTDWPRFRGPTGDGLSPAKGIPTTWSATQNVLWSADLPKALISSAPKEDHQGSVSLYDAKAFNPYSSPIVSGGKVFVATAGIRTSEHKLLCFNLVDGKLLWETVIPPGPSVEVQLDEALKPRKGRCPNLGHSYGYNCTTPCTDGERVYVTFGTGVLAAVDFLGKLLWHKTYVDLRGRENWKQPIPVSEFSSLCLASSPIVYKDMIITVCDPGVFTHGHTTTDDNVWSNAPSFIRAYDGKTGEIRYSEDRPNGPANWSTPILVTLKDKTVLMHKNSGGILGFDPANGKIIWTAKCRASPRISLVYGNGLLFTNNSPPFPGNDVAFSVDAESIGDISKNVAWEFPARNGGGFSAPVIIGDIMYQYFSGGGHIPKGATEASIPIYGQLYGVDMKTGKQLHVLDMPGFPSWSSPVATADGYIYYASGTKSYVIKTGEKPEIVGINNLGDYNYAPSPAVVDGKLIIRGSAKLWCIGKP